MRKLKIEPRRKQTQDAAGSCNLVSHRWKIEGEIESIEIFVKIAINFSEHLREEL